MNTYIEIIGPYNVNSNFGIDGIYLNNSSDAVQVMCANPSDSQFVRFGPCVVSWNGKMISTQAFVLPNVNATSSDWLQGIKIPVQVKVNGILSNVNTFYIVKPQSLGVNGVLNSPGVIGSGVQGGTNWGLRSRRGAMIVDSLILSGGGTYAVSTQDCDSSTPGNQGFLPFVIISRGEIRATVGSVLNLNADSENAGPGGGGGGGAYSEDTLAQSTGGGSGYTGGEGGTWSGGNGTGPVDTNVRFGGLGLSGVSGAFEKPGALAWYSTSQYDSGAGSQGAGGGTGMPFGTSGQGGYTVVSDLNNSVGGYGGGSGAAEGPFGGEWSGFGGGGGGNATAGTSQTSGEGKSVGNSELVPLSGGSGGAGGNPYSGLAGFGGGGGGAVALEGMLPVNNLSLQANGADGGNSAIQLPGFFSGSGGAGSGGGVILMSKISLSGCTLSVDGGLGGISTPVNNAAQFYQYGGNGGAGRVRIDGPSATSINFLPNTATSYQGPSTDTAFSVPRTFTLSGTGNGGSIRLYLRPLSSKWFLDTTIVGYAGNSWSSKIKLPGTDTMYFLAATQQVPSPASDTFTAEPSWVMSQAAANILSVPACEITSVVLDSISQTAGHHVNIMLSLGGSVALSNVDSIQVMLLYNNDLLSYDSVIRGCVDSVRVEKIDSMHTLVTLYFPTGYVLSDSTCMVADIRTTVMVTRAVSTDIEVESLSLSASGTTTLSATCPINSSFTIANSCGDSTLREFIETGTLITMISTYPNPVSSFATLHYSLYDESSVSITIYDVLGRIAARPIVNTMESSGPHEALFNTNDLPSGLYSCRFSAGGFEEFVKIVVSH